MKYTQTKWKLGTHYDSVAYMQSSGKVPVRCEVIGERFKDGKLTYSPLIAEVLFGRTDEEREENARLISLVPEFMGLLSNIHWAMLRKQKDIFIRMIESWGEADDTDQRGEAEDVEGLLTLIDKIQDFAADRLGYGEELVFGFENKPMETGAWNPNFNQNQTTL